MTKWLTPRPHIRIVLSKPLFMKKMAIVLYVICFSLSVAAQSNLPLLDISNDKSRHVVVAKGTKDVYQGHPTTVALPDGKTIFCAWSIGHGGSCGPLARTTNGGRSWELLKTPTDWTTTANCPSLYYLTDKAGKSRLMIFAARPAMSQTWSEDNGKTWTPVRSLGKPSVMAFSSITQLKNGDYLGLYHRGSGDKDSPPLKVWQAISTDGGVTWGESVMVAESEGRSPCEPAVIRSPDGNQLVCVMRENQRKGNSLMMFSKDEGKTWSKPVETPWGLTGDRHLLRYAPDGRLVAVFRDMAPASPTKGHFVLWVGTYQDLVKDLSGQYRVKLVHNFAGTDCGYPGLELLPDGTFIATTYIKYHPGPEKHSIVSTSFRIEDFDKIL